MDYSLQLLHHPASVVLYHRHYDLFLNGVGVIDDEEHLNVVGYSFSVALTHELGTAHVDGVDAAVSLLLLCHELLVGYFQLLAVAVRYAVHTDA